MEPATKRDRSKRAPLHTFKDELHSRALQVLLILNEFELLRSTWLFAFDGQKSKGRFLDLLTHLFHDTGLIDRPRQQRDAENARYTPSIYKLSKKGRAFLKRQGYQVNSLQKVGWFAHNLLASDVMADIKLAVMKQKGMRFISKAEIEERAPEATRNGGHPFSLPVSISHEWSNKKHSTVDTFYVADGWFGIEYSDGDRKSYRFFVLEINNGSNVTAHNLNDPSHLRKFLSFQELRRQKLFTKHLGITAPVVALFVQTDQATTHRSQALLRSLSDGKGSAHFAFKTIPTYQQQDRAPLPTGKALTEPWERVGFEPFHMDRPERG